jgi:hypothetical protein
MGFVVLLDCNVASTRVRSFLCHVELSIVRLMVSQSLFKHLERARPAARTVHR